MVINESYRLGGHLVGIGKIAVDGTEEYTWLDKPIHNRITSVGLDHLFCYNGSPTGGFTNTAHKGNIAAMFLGSNVTHYGALTFCKLGTGKKATEFTDTDLQTPVNGLSSTYKTGDPFTGTNVIEFGKYRLRITHIADTVEEIVKISELGLFGQYTKDDTVVNPMFARIVLDKPITVNPGEKLLFTYELLITLNNNTVTQFNSFFDMIDMNGEPLQGEKRAFFLYKKGTDGVFTDVLVNAPYIRTNATEESGLDSSIGLDNRYAFMYPTWIYNTYNNYGNFDTILYSTVTQPFTVISEKLSKARAEKGDYTFSFTDYKGVDSLDKHRDIKIVMGAYNPAMSEPRENKPIYFMRIRGIDYRFGYYNENDEWVPQALCKWANQSITFTFRTRYVTDDTWQSDTPPEPEIEEETP